MADNITKLSIAKSQDQNFIEEKIDGRILRLLGIEDVFDIDYETYLTLLKEMMVIGRMNKKKIPTEEVELITNEWKRVKGKTGRFKVKKGKINVKNVGGSVKKIQASTKKLFLGSTIKNISEEETSQDKTFYDNISKIRSVFESIYSSILNQFKLNQKEAEDKRKQKENKKRALRESALEKSIDKIKQLTSKILAPIRGILDKIFNFLWYTFLGKAFTKFIDWANNPENQKRIQAISRFLKDHWPALLAAYLLFGTTLGRFVRSITSTLISGIARFAMANPLAASAVALGGATLGAEMWRQNEQKKQVNREAEKRKVKPEVVQKELKNAQNSPMGIFGEAMQNMGTMITGMAGGGQVQKKFDNGVNINDIAFEGGGGVDNSSGLTITGAGKDTQLVAAQPGEVIMSKRAVDKYGANFFLNLNKSAGGTNIPKMVNNIQLAQGGGMVGGMFHNIRKFIGQGTGKVMAPMGAELGFQNKFLGMNMGGYERVPLNQSYTDKAAARYNALRAKNNQLDRLVRDSVYGRHFSYTPPTSYTPTFTSPSPTTTTNRGRFSKRNLNNLMQGYLGTGRGGRVEQMEEILGQKFGTITQKQFYDQLKKEYGESTVGEQRRLLLGPQSSLSPDLNPVRRKMPKTITLPPIASSAGSKTVPGNKSGNLMIPNFSAHQNSAIRELNIATYGIG
jgi:hypothetical protein